MDDSIVMSNEATESYDEETKTISCKMQNFYILLAFLSITVGLSIAVSIYCYLIKYQAKQKQLFPFHFTNNKLKEIIY